MRLHFGRRVQQQEELFAPVASGGDGGRPSAGGGDGGSRDSRVRPAERAKGGNGTAVASSAAGRAVLTAAANAAAGRAVSTVPKVVPARENGIVAEEPTAAEGTSCAAKGDAASASAQEESSAQILAAICLLYTSPSPRDQRGSRMPSSA